MGRQVLTQYYSIIASGDASSSGSDKTKQDLTSIIQGEVVLERKDEGMDSLTFSIKDGYNFMNTLNIGMDIRLNGGTLEYSEDVFTGSISIIAPQFSDEGVITLDITCYSKEWKTSGLKPKLRYYPSPNSELDWAKGSEILASDIIQNLCKDLGYKQGRLSVKKSLKYTLKSQKAQKNRTDYAFMQALATELDCTLWFNHSNGDIFYNLVATTELLASIANISFYYPVRVGDKFLIKDVTPSMIKLSDVDMTLDTADMNGGKSLNVQTNPTTGEAEIVTEQYNEELKSWQLWVLDEEKLLGESDTTKEQLITMYEESKMTWEDISQYFTLTKDYSDNPSKSPIGETLTIVKLDGDPAKGDGARTTEETRVVNGKTQKLVRTMNTKAILNESPERKAELLAKGGSGELTDEEYEKYFPGKWEDVDEASTTDGALEPEQKDEEVTDTTKKKEDGFSIEATCRGNLQIQTRLSYIIQGLGRYSGRYYLASLRHVWGSDGFKTKLTFTK